MKSSPKLARQIGSGSTSAEELPSLIAHSTGAPPSVRLRVLVSFVTSASMARRGCRGLLNADDLALSSSPSVSQTFPLIDKMTLH